MKRKQPKRSPLKAAPLRTAGQSIDEEINRVFYREIGSYRVISFSFILIVFFETWRWCINITPQPIPLWIAAIVLCTCSAIKAVRSRKKVKQLRQARDGEKAVGEYLERLREDGYQVFHDVMGNGFNIDHVLIGPAGIFTIDTKTVSKPARGNSEIDYHGETILVNGHEPDRNPIIQSKAQASWLKVLIDESTGKTIDVRPIVTYPGWFVRYPPNHGHFEVLVLNPRILPPFLGKSRRKLTLEDIKLISYSLSRYIRTLEQAKRG